MKILMLGCKEYPFGVSSKYDKKAGGGIEVHVEKLAKYLSKRGHEVFIITRRFPEQQEEETKGPIHVYRTRFVYNRYLRTITFNFSAFLRAIPLIKKHRIDLIHSHGLVGSFFGSVLSLLTGKPLVMTPHGTVDEWGLFRIPLKLFEWFSLRTAKKVIFISEFARRRMSRGRAFSHVLLSNAIDFDDIQKPRRRSWSRIRFGFIGRLEKIKGIDILVEAFKRLP
ncbi:MAG TPA: hypothetical protein ENG00_01585, partial [Candidatus Aenigmarchaeota archaeon]|nr:hypothetical protein [Candidatus Aenigmarchaeota archaeon]